MKPSRPTWTDIYGILVEKDPFEITRMARETLMDMSYPGGAVVLPPGTEYEYWGAKTQALWEERGRNQGACPYCGGSSTHTNARDGVECSGCGAPR